MAMGWGKWQKGSDQFSEELRHLPLEVDQDHDGGNHNYLTTFIKKKDDAEGYWSPCSGDSGGPLVHQDPGTKRWTIIGTLYGDYYNCVNDTRYPGSPENMYARWNKVTAHLDWIRSVLAED